MKMRSKQSTSLIWCHHEGGAHVQRTSTPDLFVENRDGSAYSAIVEPSAHILTSTKISSRNAINQFD